MARTNILDVILNTINDVQNQNRTNPNEPTADPSVFDFLKDKLSELDQKSKTNREQKGKNPESILDLIKNEINNAQRKNQEDPNVPTAPDSIFDKIRKRVDEGPKRQASAGVRKVIQDYNIDVSRIPRQQLQQIQAQYIQDRKKFDQQYAQAIYNLSQKY